MQLQHSGQPAASTPTPSQVLAMPRRAEINRFAVVLFCSLLSLGSLAPRAISEESKTAGQRQNHFLTRIKPLASVIERQATALFRSFNTCSPITTKNRSWLQTPSPATDMLKKIPECPAFDAGCCAFHAFYNILQNLRSDMELFCGRNVTQFVDANIIQLSVMLSERDAYDTCNNKDLQEDHSQVQEMKKPTTYIWQVLQKYEQFTRNTTKKYSSA